jgi:hypothetical protein
MRSMTSFSPLLATTDRLRVKEAAALARVSVGMLYRWMAEGRFKTWIVTRQGYTRAVRYIDQTTFEQFPRSHQPRVEEPIGKYV